MLKCLNVFMLFIYRQREIKSCSFSLFRLKPDLAVALFNDRFGDKEPEARADGLVFHNIIGAEEFLENMFLLVFRDAHAGVLDRCFNGFSFFGQRDLDLALAFGVFDGVVDEVLDDQGNFIRVGKDIRQGFGSFQPQDDVVSLGVRRRIVNYFLSQDIEIRLARDESSSAHFDPGNIQ